MNGISYIQANLPAAQTNFVGADGRPRWTSNRINANVANATVLGNQNEGSSWHASVALQKRFRQGFLKGAYSYGESKNTVDPGSIAAGSWTGNPIALDPNNPPVAYSNQFPGNRIFLAGSYRLEYLKFGATTFSFFWQGYNNGVNNYIYSGDLNGDGATANDLVYVPRDTSEMNFQPYTITVGGVPKVFTAADQAAAWDAYITQDSYLSQRRGSYAERYGVVYPWVFRLDFSVAQDLFKNLGSARHSLQFRADFLNFSNLLNHDWGVGQRLINNSAPDQPRGRRPGPGDVQAPRGQQRAHDQVLGDDRGPVGRLPDPVQPAVHLQLDPPDGASEGRAGAPPLGPCHSESFGLAGRRGIRWRRR